MISSGQAVQAQDVERLGRHARARIAVEGWLVEVQKAKARASQGIGQGEGARSPAGPAQRPVALEEISEEQAGETVARVTPLGYRTAVRLPKAIRSLSVKDGRRWAAQRYAHVHELIGAVPVSGMEPGGGSLRVSDGGAVFRVGLVEELRGFQFAIGTEACLVPRSRRGRRRQITVRVLVDMVCLSGLEIRDVLKAHGWGRQARYVAHLTDGLLDALDRMAVIEHWDQRRQKGG
jgi:hypothetical protein